MSSRLLTLDDLIQFYSKKKKSMSFNAEKSGEPIVVQVDGKMSFAKEDFSMGLTPVSLQACHTEKNLNKSSISFETMQNRMLPSFKNRPILGYIHTVDGEPYFSDHRMHIEINKDDEEEIVYDEVAVGIIPETNNASLEYDEKNDRYNVMVDGYLFESYTKAVEILQREQECACSVEIVILKMSWDAKNGCLNIEDGYISGVTILGINEDGSKVMPGMAGSNIRLKDFSQSNNSIFSDLSEEENSKLIETLEKLNKTLSKFSINENYRKEENAVMNEIEVNNESIEVTAMETNAMETESTENTIVNNSEESNTPEVVETEKCKTKENTEESIETEKCNPKKDNAEEVVENCAEEVTEDEKCKTEKCSEDEVTEDEKCKEKCSEDVTEDEKCKPKEDCSEDVTEDEKCNPKKDNAEESVDNTSENFDENVEENIDKFSKTFELSHEDIRCSLYNLLAEYEEANNDCYYICAIYDNYFIYNGCYGDFYGQKYIKTEDEVSFEGEPYKVYVEFLTEEEKTSVDDMRANYSSIQEELNNYKEAEMFADKMTVFEDEAYSAYLDTEEFKNLMSKEIVNKFSKEELTEKADAALGKVVKATRTFAVETNKEEAKPSVPSFIAFAKTESSSFLDGLLNKKN